MDNNALIPIKTRHAVLCDATCAACAYMSKLDSMMTCGYLLVTGHRRGCPPGRGCTRRKSGDKMKTIEQQIAMGRVERSMDEVIQDEKAKKRAYSRAHYERHREEILRKNKEKYYKTPPEKRKGRQPMTPEQRRAKRLRAENNCRHRCQGRQAAAIKAYRTEHGISQRELSRRIGANEASVQNWEAERYMADWSKLSLVGIQKPEGL